METKAKTEKQIERDLQRAEVNKRRSNASPKTVSLNELLFPVDLTDEELPSNSEYSRRVIGIIGGSDFLLNQCSPRYELVKNVDIFPEIEKVLNANSIIFTPEYKHVEHVKFFADYQLTDPALSHRIIDSNDIIQPMLRVQHSYNGLTKYRIVFGYFRLVCSNGLVIPVKEMAEYNLVIVGKHTESILHSFSKLNEMLTNFFTNKKITAEILSKYDGLGGRMVVKPQDRILEVLKATGINAVDNSKFNTVDNIMGRINVELNQNLGYKVVNDWLVYNGINQYINDNSVNIASPDKRSETDSKVFEYMLEYA